MLRRGGERCREKKLEKEIEERHTIVRVTHMKSATNQRDEVAQNCISDRTGKLPLRAQKKVYVQNVFPSVI
jgi:hypothetical protein